MRRLLLILLLALFPLQASWAAVTAYCQHEEGAAAQHLGHHDHQHKASSSDENDPPRKAAAGSDLDCAACHASHVQPMPPDAGVLPPFSAPSPELRLAPAYLSITATVPEKPNWRAGSIAGETLSHS